MKVAALQMVSGHQVPDNIASAERLIAQAADAGAELVVLPEYWCLMGQRDRDKLSIAEAAGGGPLQDFMAAQAARHGITLVGGTVPLHSGQEGKVFNACLVFDRHGQPLARYDKIHLFSYHKGREAYNEGKLLQAGEQPVAFAMQDRSGQSWRIGLSICYDLRFPELYRALEADVYVAPSAFTYTTGQAHWELLLRARAVENLAYMLAATQGGTHSNGRRTWGHATAINPWGEVLQMQAEGEAVVLADLDWQALQNWRLQLPALRHKKLR